jgi:hypothetical protein
MGAWLHRDCNALGDAVKTSPRIPSIFAQNAIPSFQIIHIIRSHQMYVAIDNPLFIPSFSCLTTSSDLWNHVDTADDVSHAEMVQSNYCWCISDLYKY